MDTLWLAGEREEFARCLRWVTDDMDLNVDQVRFCFPVAHGRDGNDSMSPLPAFTRRGVPVLMCLFICRRPELHVMGASRLWCA